MGKEGQPYNAQASQAAGEGGGGVETVLKDDFQSVLSINQINQLYLKHGKWLSKLVFRHAV